MMKRIGRATITSLCLLWGVACGSTATTPAPAHPSSHSTNGTELARKESTTVLATADSPTRATPGDEPLPANITSLFEFVGAKTPLIINIPRTDRIIAALDPETRDAIAKDLTNKIGQESRFETAVVKSILTSFDGAVIFSDPKNPSDGSEAAEDAACIAAKFRDPQPIEVALSTKEIEKNGPRFIISGAKDKNRAPLHGIWLASSGMLVACASPNALSQSLTIASGSLPSYAKSPRFVAERANDLFISVDMHSILGDSVEPGSDFFASLTASDQSLGLDLRLGIYGPTYPPLGTVVAPAPQTLVGYMPKGTIGAIGISLKRSAGKDLASVFSLLDRTTGGNKLQEAKDAAAKIGIEFADIDAALGDELAVGVYRNSKDKIDFEKSDGFKNTAVLVALATNDENAHKKIWNVLANMTKKRPKEVLVKADSLESLADPKSKKKEYTRIESRKGLVIFATGDKIAVKEALSKFGKTKETLASTDTFSQARATEKPAMHMLAFLDSATLKSLVAEKTDKPREPTNHGPANHGPAFLSLVLGPSDRGLELALGGGGAMELIGTGAKLALGAFKSFEADSKTSEARMNVRFISNYARRAYERELTDGKGARLKLCKSATPVPKVIPKGMTYKTSMGTGGDWDTGDENSGWKCLDFFTSDEVRYQYEYRQGGDYKGPKRGGPNPGPNGFEVSAEGDLDGDGKTSLFTRTGKIVGGKVVLDDDVFASDPSE